MIKALRSLPDVLARLAEAATERDASHPGGHEVPAVAIALAAEGQVAWAGAWGHAHVDTGEPVTDATLFEAASLSKPVFAAAVLRLAESGALDLDAPLASLLDEPIVPDDPRSATITARMALSHSTGLQNWLWAPDERPKLSFDPGEGFGYSSLAFQFLQRAIERSAGEDVESLTRRLVLDPLGMPNSTFVWGDRCAAICATGHDAAGQPVEKWHPAEPLACASLHTTATDYARFLAALTATCDSGVLGRGLVDRMLAPQAPLGERLAWGLGWGLQECGRGDLFWHWGDNGCFKAVAVGSRSERLAVVTLTNGANGLMIGERVACTVLGDDQPAFNWLHDFYA